MVLARDDKPEVFGRMSMMLTVFSAMNAGDMLLRRESEDAVIVDKAEK